MFCKNCSAPLPDDAKFCDSCGTPVTPPAPPPPVQPTEPVHPPVKSKRKKKGGKVVLIIVAIVLVVSLLLGSCCCTVPLLSILFNGSGQNDSDHTTGGNSYTPTNAGVSGTTAGDLTVRQAELVYELTDEDMVEFYDLLALSEDKALFSDDGIEVEGYFDQLDEKYEYLETQHGIAMVLYYCDLNDQEASDLYLDCTDIVTQANNDYLEMARRLYQSDTSHKEMLFEDWTEEEIRMLLAYSEEIMHLQQRNSEIEVAYQDMQDSATMYDDMVPLYLEMVENNNRIAQIYGYDNYYTYAYDQVYDRDYDSNEVETMRDLVATYLCDAMVNSLNSFVSAREKLSNREMTQLSQIFVDPYYNGSEEILEGYLYTLPDQARTDMVDMFNGNILLMDTASGAMEGAFTTNLTADRSICFFGPGYSNTMTVVHEVGHYYGSKHEDLDELPLDLAEVQSQGNEWLFTAYLEGCVKSDLHDALLHYKMYENMTTIVISTIVDEFEERVYTHPNPSSLTGDDLDDIMTEVCLRYGGTGYLSSVLTDVQQYWRLVVVEQPVYYISYAVSAIAALDVYTVAAQDYESGVNIYCSLIENVDVEEGFLANITGNGLSGPFDDDVYLYIDDLYN